MVGVSLPGGLALPVCGAQGSWEPLAVLAATGAEPAVLPFLVGPAGPAGDDRPVGGAVAVLSVGRSCPAFGASWTGHFFASGLPVYRSTGVPVYL